MTVHSGVAAKKIEAEIEMPDRTRPAPLLIRLRHPAGARIRSVQVNGWQWMDFDASKEWVRVEAPGEKRYTIVANY